MKDDFGFGSFGNDNKKEKKEKGKKAKGNKFSLGNDFGFQPLGGIDFGFSSPKGKEPQIDSMPASKAPSNDFGMIGLGGMFGSSNKSIKAPKMPKMPQRKVSNTQKFEDKLKQQAAENKIKEKYGIKPAKGSAVAPQAPTLSERVAAFKNKRYEDNLRKKAGIPKDFEANIAAEKNKAEIEARTAKATERYYKNNEVYDEKTGTQKSKIYDASKLEKLKAKIKKNKSTLYQVTVTKEGDSKTLPPFRKLEDAQLAAGSYRANGYSVSPIQQIIV